jgi:hypothetical protein
MKLFRSANRLFSSTVIVEEKKFVQIKISYSKFVKTWEQTGKKVTQTNAYISKNV